MRERYSTQDYVEVGMKNVVLARYPALGKAPLYFCAWERHRTHEYVEPGFQATLEECSVG